ncbi:hypothetical protein HK105_200637 [Polyrhizophydium stewartii]|uniref:S1/P1 nuclease n=1 Tax=Polyrhizophydium stewartii TaxID=2732419 RepID=A0ABR4NJM3_9FUNG
MRAARPLLALAAALCTLPAVAAYGRIGHWLSGRIAQAFMTADAAQLALELLPQYKGFLADAAPWADEIKSDHSYDWAKHLHYVNPKDDNPPEKCTYHPGPDDCPDGCVVTAITNYTMRLVQPAAAAAAAAGIAAASAEGGAGAAIPDRDAREEALKFLLHFIGDLHQPLHATGRDRGGNSVRVRFAGRLVSLHAVWDSLMFEKRIRDNFRGNRNIYAGYLINEIVTTWLPELVGWVNCTTPVSAMAPPTSADAGVWAASLDADDGHPETPAAAPAMLASMPVCPERWARYANLVNCVYVWRGIKRRVELSGKYYDTAIPVAEKMLAQAAIRIAAALDAAAKIIYSASPRVSAASRDEARAAARLAVNAQLRVVAAQLDNADALGGFVLDAPAALPRPPVSSIDLDRARLDAAGLLGDVAIRL